MREKWDKKSEKTINDGQPVPQRLTYMSEPMYKPKLLLKSPSLRAIKNYNNLSIQDNSTQNTFDNLSFIPESESNPSKYDEPYTISSMSNYSHPSDTVLLNTYDVYDYANTIRSSSGRTSNGSELGSEKAEMGSTVKLVQTKMERSLQTWCTHLNTILCTVALAANFGNLYRLPQIVFTNGGLPFLVAYVILVVFIGLPLMFLELGIGQLAQEGYIKSWRAVPFFRGVGYIKLLAGCLLSIYYPLYMGLALFYIIWLAKEQAPFKDCKVVKLTEDGYTAHAISAEKCLSKTFLESPTEEPGWYGIYAGLLLITWIIIMILSIRRTKSFSRSLSFLIFPTLGCYIALIVKAILTQSEYRYNAKNDSSNWTTSQMTNFDAKALYKDASIWYYALIQVFFSTNVGFGAFVTNAGMIYNKVNPLWTSIGYMLLNILFGVGAVIVCNVLSVHVNPTDPGTVLELQLMKLIYNITVNSQHEGSWQWAIVAYMVILLAGFISMAMITYALLKAITIQNKRRLKWWQTSIVFCFIGLVFGCAALLVSNFQIVHLLDHYIVGNLILITVILEVLALLAFYGTERIKSDFEFMLGHILSKVWIVLWWIAPLLLITIFAWGLSTIPLEGAPIVDPEWLYGTGWGVVLVATLYIFVIGLNIVSKQDGYTFFDKLKSSLKPSCKWGPKDPIMRHNWIQWNSKAQQGERDFTLKRRGTKEYTRSVKRNAKKLNIAANSELSTTTASGEYHRKDDLPENIPNGNTNYREPYYLNNNHTTMIRINGNGDASRPLRITSLVDTLDTNNIYGKTSLNPLARSHTYSGPHSNDNNSEGYGTFRKGPYVISDNGVEHVCHRRYSQSEDATEL